MVQLIISNATQRLLLSAKKVLSGNCKILNLNNKSYSKQARARRHLEAVVPDLSAIQLLLWHLGDQNFPFFTYHLAIL